METLLIIFLIIIASLILLFASRFLKTAFRIATNIFLIFIIITTVLTILVYKDLSELKQDITTKKSIFILRENGTYYAAVGIYAGRVGELNLDSFDYYNTTQLSILKSQLESGNVTNNTGRAFLITPELINKTLQVDIGVNLDENDILEVLKSEDVYEVLADKMRPEFTYTPQNLKNSYGDEGKIKGYLLAASIINYFQITDIELADDMKKGNIEVVPDSVTFSIIKWIPFI